MSQEYYQRVLSNEIKNFKELARDDEQVTLGGMYDNKIHEENGMGALFVRYVMTANRLGELADELQDPITVPTIRKVYELTVSRALQLSVELTRLQAVNTPCLDTILIRHYLTPFDIQFKVPTYFIAERETEIQIRKQFLENLRKKIESENSHKELENKEKIKMFETLKNINSADDNFKSCFGHKSSPKCRISRKDDCIPKDQAAKDKNKDVQQILREKYNEKKRRIEAILRKEFTARIEEDIEDELREWIEQFYALVGEFPPFPGPEAVYLTGETYGVPKKLLKHFVDTALPSIPKTNYSRDFAGVSKLEGSAIIPAGYWINAELWLKCKAALKNKDRKESHGKKKKNQKKTQGENAGFLLRTKEHFSILNILINNFRYPSADIENDIKVNVFNKLGMEIRNGVDNQIRLELKLLQDALYKDRYPKKKKRQREKNKFKVKKIKGMKNVAAEKSKEDCMEELLRSGVLKEASEARLENYIADGSWAEQPDKSNREIVTFLLERCVLPLSSASIHEFTPLSRSFCLLGPEHSGKHYLAQAVVAATAATLFDLSPTVTAHIYPGKKGLKILMALVERLSRELQPSVILVSDVEKVFCKKVPEQEKGNNLRRLQVVLPKFVKGITAKDRIIVIGTSTQPWLADRKKLTRTFDYFLNIPLTHYGTHLLLWSHFLQNFSEKLLTTLPEFSSRLGYSYQDMASTFEALDEKNVKEQSYETFEKDIVIGLSERHTVSETYLLKLQHFLNSTPLGKIKLQKDREQEGNRKERREYECS